MVDSAARRRSTITRVPAQARRAGPVGPTVPGNPAPRGPLRTLTRITSCPGVALSPPAVRLRSAVCLLGRFPALAGVDLEVVDGEVVLVAGPNGAGKTTLLRLLAGLVPLAGGEGTVLGHDLATDRHGARRELALLGHAPGCYDDLTVRENVRFWARAAGRRRVDADAAVDALGLGRVADVAFGRLSAGQQRRTGLAVVAARRPRLLLLDEPHAGLDASGRDILDGLIRSAASDGRTVLLSSHELDRARALAGREITLVAGQVRRAEIPARPPPTAEPRPSPTR